MCGGDPRGFSDAPAKPDAGTVGDLEGILGGVGGADAISQFGSAVGRAGQLRQPVAVDLAALRMQVEHALAKLGHLAHAAGDADARHRISPQIFQHAADEIAHVDQRDFVQAVQLLHRLFAGIACRARDMLQAHRARDVDAAVDRMDPRRAGIRHDDAGRAEDGDAADDAEPAVQRALGDFLAAGHRDLDHHIARAAARRGDLGDRRAYHLARHRIDGGFTGRQRQSRARHGAHAIAGAKRDAAPRLAQAHHGDDQRAMRDVGIVAGILDDAGAGEAIAAFLHRQRKGRARAAGQQHRHRIGKFAGQQRLVGGAGRCGGAGAGGPAAAQIRRVGNIAHREPQIGEQRLSQVMHDTAGEGASASGRGAV